MLAPCPHGPLLFTPRVKPMALDGSTRRASVKLRLLRELRWSNLGHAFTAHGCLPSCTEYFQGPCPPHPSACPAAIRGFASLFPADRRPPKQRPAGSFGTIKCNNIRRAVANLETARPPRQPASSAAFSLCVRSALIGPPPLPSRGEGDGFALVDVA
jgi:hypothetical protein